MTEAFLLQAGRLLPMVAARFFAWVCDRFHGRDHRVYRGHWRCYGCGRVWPAGVK